ncbi:hypothetical protein V9T40_008170 [Parthenolecanium corni]|uniref:Uncharacterized protein n=1 Tax=Parthenolecanium corni TaxID=536013 RepID=A0AAN9TTH0_9HEMI
MLRSILGIRLKDKVRVETIRQKINAADIGWDVRKLKCNHAGHLATETDSGSKIFYEWTPLESRRGAHPPGGEMKSPSDLAHFGRELPKTEQTGKGWWKPMPGIGRTRQHGGLPESRARVQGV